MKLNVGCGFDYREGFVNIDGDGTLPRVDKVIDLTHESITSYFGKESLSGAEPEHILASDFIEHHTHWEATRLLRDFFSILRPGGTLEMKLPDFESIINGRHTAHQKIMMLFGGQDIPQGDRDPSHRKMYPQYFCHKYAYTQEMMRQELQRIGFVEVETKPDYTNFIVTAKKPAVAVAAA